MKLRYFPLVLLAGVGCSSSSGPPTPPGADASAATEASASDAATTETGSVAETGTAVDSASEAAGDDAGPPCNTIVNAAPVVNVTQIAADPPTPQGGMLTDGTYWGTSVDIYTGPTGPTGTTGTWQATALIQGETVQLVNTGMPFRRTITLTLTAADAGFASVDTCPDGATAQGGYTATSTSLTIFLPGGTDDAGARTVVETLTKQ